MNVDLMSELVDLEQAIQKRVDKLHEEIAALKKDRIILAMRVWGESPETYSPETNEVMERMEPLIQELFKAEA